MCKFRLLDEREDEVSHFLSGQTKIELTWAFPLCSYIFLAYIILINALVSLFHIIKGKIVYGKYRDQTPHVLT